ncbi:Hsp20/alpha crystallin family protein [Bacillus infantis]|jgi:HSP20 family molecular chaperone IbpA|uniref:Hsp20/alpha crystallin family protein n=1 Tax=Bacillus infantis TaxID=324767 RepID=UPI001CD71F5A|nr:Hsp20/alpha crystallin family protein [Bacillus infantis]MCA1039988.1 Hsp20/alpha crystallin family protein [Bacillus infantis]MCP1159173.1 Hsp20/alpha crystallin family protein [Bacillus infantis]MCR6611593.1 Hsp20/alpha crystallin family protein [Bacillus infantis]
MFPWNLFPFNKDMKKTMQQLKPDEIDKYVQNMMGQLFPQSMQGMGGPQNMMQGFSPFQQGNSDPSPAGSSKLDASVYETHDYVFVRVGIKDESWLKQLKLYHTSNQIILEHIPEYDNKHTITLPALVKRKGSSASFKDSMLEVRIPKNIDMQFSEIEVTEIL